MNVNEIERVQEFLDALSELTRRTGIVVCEHYDGVCLRVETPAPADAARGSARYVVHYNPRDRTAGRFGDLLWSDDDDAAQPRDAITGAPGVLRAGG